MKNNYTFGGGIFAAVLVCLANFMNPSNAFAQSAETATPPAVSDVPQPWVVNCNATANSPDLFCIMSQQIRDRNTGLLIVGASVRPVPRLGGHALQIQLPHGIKLPEGVEVGVDEGQVEKHPIIWGDRNGSYTEIRLTDNWLGAMRRGNILRIAVSSRTDQIVRFEISLRGFTNAFEKL